MRSIPVCEAGSEAHEQERSDLRSRMSKGKNGRTSGVLHTPDPGVHPVAAKRMGGEVTPCRWGWSEGRGDGNLVKIRGTID